MFDAASAHSTILRWREDPVAFVREALSAQPEPWQATALSDIAAHDRVSIRSGHGVGKSTLLSWVILWYMSTHYPVKVACTAPSSGTLYDVLWSEVRLWLRKMPDALQSQFVVTADRISLAGGGDSFASARTARADNPDALQGFHSENMLFVIDEAPGVPDVIFEVAAGAMSTPGAKQIMTGNPTRTKGYFARSHRPNSGFHRIHVSCNDSSRVSQTWVKEMGEEYGVDSNVYRVRVLGEFPTSDEETLISMELIDEAVNRQFDFVLKDCTWGLDVARYGADRSCLVKRYPQAMIDQPMIFQGLSTMELTGRVVAEYERTPERQRPNKIYCDVIGIGSGVVDRLRELKLPVIGVNVSESPAFAVDNVFRMRDELWDMARKWFESKQVRLINTGTAETLVNELSSIKKYYTSSGKMRVESKDDMKKRGLRSPDVADAFILTFAYQSSIGMGNITRMSDWKKPLIRNLKGVV